MTVTAQPQNVIAQFLTVARPQFPNRSAEYAAAVQYDQQQAAQAAYDAATAACEAQGGTYSADGCYIPPPSKIYTTPLYIYATSDNTYTPGQCVWAVKNWKPEVPGGLGNASNWGYALGYDSNPTVGSVAWTTAGYFGHVALVVAVANGQVEIKEMNGYLGPWNVDYQWEPASSFYYIHI